MQHDTYTCSNCCYFDPKQKVCRPTIVPTEWVVEALLQASRRASDDFEAETLLLAAGMLLRGMRR